MADDVKQQGQDGSEPAELETNQLDDVAGGRLALKGATKNRGGTVGVIADPCEGGE